MKQPPHHPQDEQNESGDSDGRKWCQDGRPHAEKQKPEQIEIKGCCKGAGGDLEEDPGRNGRIKKEGSPATWAHVLLAPEPGNNAVPTVYMATTELKWILRPIVAYDARVFGA